MKALILNSGLGKRMGKYTEHNPKCMVPLEGGTTIVARQLALLQKCGMKEVVMTTGPYADLLEEHVRKAGIDMKIQFINNPKYGETNYIYSIYLAREFLKDEIILMHGDLVYEESVLQDVIDAKHSCMAVSSMVKLPEKDFKAVIKNGRITAVGIEFMENALAAQPLYHLTKEDWMTWLEEIVAFCERGEVTCYAENAMNQVSGNMQLYPFDYKERICQEVDKEENLMDVRKKLGLN